MKVIFEKSIYEQINLLLLFFLYIFVPNKTKFWHLINQEFLY